MGLGAVVGEAGSGTLELVLAGDFGRRAQVDEATITNLGVLAARSVCLAALPAGSEVSAIELKFNFQHAAKGEQLRASAQLVRQGRSILSVRCDVVGVGQSETLPVALMQASFLRQ